MIRPSIPYFHPSTHEIAPTKRRNCPRKLNTFSVYFISPRSCIDADCFLTFLRSHWKRRMKSTVMKWKSQIWERDSRRLTNFTHKVTFLSSGRQNPKQSIMRLWFNNPFFSSPKVSEEWTLTLILGPWVLGAAATLQMFRSDSSRVIRAALATTKDPSSLWPRSPFIHFQYFTPWRFLFICHFTSWQNVMKQSNLRKFLPTVQYGHSVFHSIAEGGRFKKATPALSAAHPSGRQPFTL